MLHVIKLRQENLYKKTQPTTTTKKTQQQQKQNKQKNKQQKKPNNLFNQNLNAFFKLRDLWKKVSLEEEGLDLHGHSAAGMVVLTSPATASLLLC